MPAVRKNLDFLIQKKFLHLQFVVLKTLNNNQITTFEHGAELFHLIPKIIILNSNFQDISILTSIKSPSNSGQSIISIFSPLGINKYSNLFLS